MGSQGSTHVRFGVFELNLRTRELRKRGIKIKLQHQPFAILEMSVERAGEVVSRDQIRKKLWPDTKVDYERGLNAALARLRRAIGDSAENPRFLETLPRLGYRFIAAVEFVERSPEHDLSLGAVRDVRPPLATKNAGHPDRDAAPPAVLIGRDAERDQLLRLVDAARAGRGALALIGGEPGIGKTHLTRSVLMEARRRGCFTLIGHCYDTEDAPPYVPFIEMLEYCARVVPPANLRHSMGDSAPEIAKLMPELRRIFPDIPPPAGLAPEQQRRFLFNACREFLERSARFQPIVAVFEDLQWADEPALLLLRHLAQTVAAIPLLIIGTYRDVDLDVARPFAGALESWIRENSATRLALHRLDPSGVQAMLSALSGNTPPPSLVSAIFEQTEGNPFFVLEVFHHLAEQGKLLDQQNPCDLALQTGALQVPESLRLVIGRRLAKLREETKRVLTTAAVIGRSFDLRLLEALESGRPDAALDATEEAERAHLVEPDRGGRDVRYRFVHELVRQTLVESLALPRRRRLHGRVADAIEGLCGAKVRSHASAIAHHLYQAGAAADLDKTIAYLLMAQEACAGAAHEEALANVDTAFALVEAERHPLTAQLHGARAVALRSLSRFPRR